MYVCMYVCTHTLLYIYAGNIYIKKKLTWHFNAIQV